MKLAASEAAIIIGLALAIIIIIIFHLSHTHSQKYGSNNNNELDHRLIISNNNEGIAKDVFATRSNDTRLDKLLLDNSSYISTPYIKEYSMPNGTWPNGILVDKKGIVWTVGTKSGSLISFDPIQRKIRSVYPIHEGIVTKSNIDIHKSLPLPVTKPEFRMVWSIVEDKDGSIWFSGSGKEPLWHFQPSIEKFDVIHSVSGAPMQMKVDPKTDNIWYTLFAGNKIGVIQKFKNEIRNSSSSGNIGNYYSSNSSSRSSNYHNNISNNISQYKVTEFDLGNDTFPSGLQLQGNSVWVTLSLKNMLVELEPISDSSRKVTDIKKVLAIPSSSSSSSSLLSTVPSSSIYNQTSSNNSKLFSTPSDLVVFGNRSVWITEHGTSFITKYDLISHDITRFPTSPSFHQYITLPYWIASTPRDDKRSFWFNEHTGNRIAFFNITDMTLTEYEIPTRDPSNGYLANALTLAIDPTDNNKIWFTEFNHDKIGVIDHSIPVPLDIHSSPSKVVLSSSGEKEQDKQHQQQIIGIVIEKHKVTTNQTPSNNNNNNVLFLKVASSMKPTAQFVNLTAMFFPQIINFAKIDQGNKIHSQLELQINPDTPPGNYTLGVSVTDGTVAKSGFIDMIIK